MKVIYCANFLLSGLKLLMKILQVSISDIGGGGERVAWDLHHEYLERGHDALLVVGEKFSDHNTVVGLNPKSGSISLILHKFVRRFEYLSGIQALGYWRFRQWWKNNNQQWDIVHLHNLHANYFDLSMLSEISKTTLIIHTLHDCWQFTGHCAHPFNCERWQIGCGHCPDLSTYPAVKRDQTRFNWKRKRKFYNIAKPILVVPSRWLQVKVESSFLIKLTSELIYNGIDTKKFHPGNRLTMRSHLDLPLERNILLYVAHKGLNAKQFKDPEMLLEAIRILVYKKSRHNILLLVVGGIAPLPVDLSYNVMQREDTRQNIEMYYQAADLFLHPSKADNCPLVIIEAMACGLPVISTDVGGVKEIIMDGISGSIVPSGNPDAFADAIDENLRTKNLCLSEASLEHIRSEFSLNLMADKYLALYKKIVTNC